MRHQDHAYVIYTKPYRETSAIVKLFTAQSGILSGVVKGVQGKSRQSASLRSALQIGNWVEFQWLGKSSLKNIFQIELIENPPVLSTKKFMCLSYINELLLYVLPEEQASVNLYQHYKELLQSISLEETIERLLRVFELTLLDEMGYATDFAWDVNNEEPVNSKNTYVIIPGTGVIPAVDTPAISAGRLHVSGEALLLIAARDLSCDTTLLIAKKVNRLLLDYHLDGRVLKTRKLYQQLFIDNQNS